jgi:hypothetical protein
VKAVVTRARCEHKQEYGDTYARSLVELGIDQNVVAAIGVTILTGTHFLLHITLTSQKQVQR